MTQLSQLIYVSKSCKPLGSDDLKQLLKKIRPRNEIAGISGMLLFDGGSFFQVLEGERTRITTLFEEIKTDPRHHSVVSILERPIRDRQFPDWSMGFAELNDDLYQQIEGLNDFYSAATCLNSIDPGRATKILQAFSQGRWH